jgi:hypothetical protein
MQLMQVCARLAAESIAKLGNLLGDQQSFPADVIEWVIDAVCCLCCNFILYITCVYLIFIPPGAKRRKIVALVVIVPF